MTTLTFYHNPKCSKSREVAAMLEASGKEFEVREYLKEPLSKEELEKLYSHLSPDDKKQFIRVKEQLFKDDPFDINDESKVFQKLVELPKLMERPIVSDSKLAIIGRPTSKIQELIS
jgi:arsenate reductase